MNGEHFTIMRNGKTFRIPLSDDNEKMPGKRAERRVCLQCGNRHCVSHVSPQQALRNRVNGVVADDCTSEDGEHGPFWIDGVLDEEPVTIAVLAWPEGQTNA